MARGSFKTYHQNQPLAESLHPTIHAPSRSTQSSTHPVFPLRRQAGAFLHARADDLQHVLLPQVVKQTIGAQDQEVPRQEVGAVLVGILRPVAPILPMAQLEGLVELVLLDLHRCVMGQRRRTCFGQGAGEMMRVGRSRHLLHPPLQVPRTGHHPVVNSHALRVVPAHLRLEHHLPVPHHPGPAVAQADHVQGGSGGVELREHHGGAAGLLRGLVPAFQQRRRGERGAVAAVRQLGAGGHEGPGVEGGVDAVVGPAAHPVGHAKGASAQEESVLAAHLLLGGVGGHGSSPDHRKPGC
ncbi:hypothetical protein F751_4898 [Auxenochlorella protothecoides]|uniref:Uncharacterized protein n=1 Tax=Auxenochlorella protothecoides TaxID=3075 RepID=A0A087SL01_AUXPR|nr:hypothetical protein F751_4898 [Auxenochlorella protothecoides]KFM26405.1 hypothetical protein F751_4898 [Auxenochlorella protothecoides]